MEEGLQTPFKFWTNMNFLKILYVCEDRKSTRDKANINNQQMLTSLTANPTPADCVQISLGPSIQYIPLRVYHTGGFDAMSPSLIAILY